MNDQSDFTGMTGPTGTPKRPVLRRVREGRLLFGVCGGIARYFGLDVTLVRVACVLLGLVPPIGGMLVLAYLVLAVIVPEEGLEHLAGREQVKENLASLRDEFSNLAETVRARITREPLSTLRTPASPPTTTTTGSSVQDTSAAPAESTPPPASRAA